MKQLAKFFGLLFLTALLCSNVSQPGVYNSGGMAFTMLFPEDSLTYKKVQMKEEKIFIQLYKGYAVVKGTYKMVNSTPEKFSFRMGYPIRGIYNGGNADLNQVSLDSIYKFKIETNGKGVAIDRTFYEQKDPVITFGNSNWLTWKMDFLPNETLDVAVYFIVNTNSANTTKGYNKKRSNAFIYLLESGSVWKQPIVKGDFNIELKDDLKLDDIDGISDHFNFKKDLGAAILYGTKADFSPSPNDNLIITYFKTMENFDFNLVLKSEKALYSTIDLFSKTKQPTQLVDFETENPYEVPTTFLGFIPLIVTNIFIYGPIVLFGIFLFIIFKILYRRLKSKF
jgi:hypothetical protein